MRTMRCAVALVVMAAAIAGGQTRGTTPAPAARPLGPVTARSAQTFASVSRLMVSRGTVFVNDATARQLWMLDPDLKAIKPALDSTSGLGKEGWYGDGPALQGLRRWRGDSLLFQPMTRIGTNGFTPSAEGLVFGPEGKMGRILSMPPGGSVPCPVRDIEDSGWYTCSVILPNTNEPPVDIGDSIRTRAKGDSSAIVSVNFRNGDADTLARFTSSPRTMTQTKAKNANVIRGVSEQPVLYLEDVWGAMRDGTLIIARGADYHLDIIDIKGQLTKGPKAPFNWRRVTDEDRDRLIDSMRVSDSINNKRIDSLLAANPPADGMPRPVSVRPGPTRQSPDQWASYWPPFRPVPLGRAILTDEDGRIWVDERQPKGSDSVTVYGIFDKKGQFLERVSIPSAQTVLGFGPGGVVYLSSVNAGRTTILKARFK